MGQRIKRWQAFEKATVLSSGYVLADNSEIDIIDAWWCLRLPNWSYEYNPSRGAFGMAQKSLFHIRSQGFRVYHDFGDLR